MPLFNSNLITKTFDGSNCSYILNDEHEFSLTEYKILKNQPDTLIKCSKLLYNGKIKLIYFTANYIPFNSFAYSADLNLATAITANLINSVVSIQQNGFLNCNNIDLAFDKIFVNPQTAQIGLIYLPVNNRETNYLSFENEFKANLIKFIYSVPSFSGGKYDSICNYLSNGSLSLKDIYNGICSEAKDIRYIDSSHKNTQPAMNLYAYNSPYKFSIKISKPKFIIGKLPDKADGIITFNKAISRVHCEILYKNNQYFIKDLNSVNGTFVNGFKLKPEIEYKLHSGDLLRLANSDFKIKF